ncbi:hypothetical protein [Altererythrobacter lutimaris]|uniref:Uncharacterized protein n=1 Tax=Altererythrobacter lutimaris TaxID=2743979 RepID=A0A850H7M8_9SPHN|nr:hypothetical protein [Altererythrobacter lutimaris]NVE93883.1 hypothetical protein [Altererythrobacter lutimaris]
MIEVYVPFLLVMMSWNADDPEASMRIQTRVLIDQATCEARGAETAALVEADRSERMERFTDARDMIAKERFVWRCVEAPKHIEKVAGGS